MTNSAVIGLGFGDEGKGRVVNWLCNTDPTNLNIRFSGGHQAGHHAFLNSAVSHVFSNFGSGTFQGVPTYISKFCTIDPIGIINEWDILRDKCPGINPILYINPKCPVVTPFDKIHNQIMENKNKHGTCGVGFGATLEREENHYSLLAEDLLIPSILKIKLELIADYYDNPNKYNINEIMQDFGLFNQIENIKIEKPDLKQYPNKVFEGSQGILLDQDCGFFPHVTRSNTTTQNILKMEQTIDHVFLVTRAYQTRHGNGPMTNESLYLSAATNKHEQNFSDGAQGDFRTSVLDLDLLKYAMMKEFSHSHSTTKYTLVITCLDLLWGYEFTENGKLEICRNEMEFINKISKRLPRRIKNIYLSREAFGDMGIFIKGDRNAPF